MDEKGQFLAELSEYRKALRADESFDVVVRVFMVSDKQAAFFFIDGMIKDETMQKMMQGFAAIKPEDMPESAAEFAKYQVPYVEVEVLKDIQTAVNSVLSGAPCLLIEGYHQAISIDFRTYPARGVEEPEKDKVMRGSRDGFVETLVFNTALIRRRIRDPKLTMEY